MTTTATTFEANFVMGEFNPLGEEDSLRAARYVLSQFSPAAARVSFGYPVSSLGTPVVTNGRLVPVPLPPPPPLVPPPPYQPQLPPAPALPPGPLYGLVIGLSCSLVLVVMVAALCIVAVIVKTRNRVYRRKRRELLVARLAGVALFEE